MTAEEVVKYIIGQLVEHPDEVEVTTVDEEITVIVAKSDMGKVIGRQGKIAKAVRTIVRSVGMKENKKYTVEIKERETGE